MKCVHCGSEDTAKGVLEGVSFVPDRAAKKHRARGVYGIVAVACVSCGALATITVNPEALQSILKTAHEA
jgi:hypothetical protein